ncbi:expressed unknown protein [Seminavis robusta]|uniref:WD40 repeat domain-containing protein n=1 Tax=Seminavis robusta TaxID=568900 RepID=A0A9N8DZS1_9STRA|nr:expressed unknown protein [Seminavis robusta]|eukprot:Sro508_g156810.1 n/a (323) ;mRNA; f:40925-41893
MFLDKNGLLYLFSAALASIFVWDVQEQEYRATIPLIEEDVRFAAYSPDNHEIYTFSASPEGANPTDGPSAGTGLIRRIDLAAGPPYSQDPLAIIPGLPDGMVTAGEFIFVSFAWPWDEGAVLASNGTLLSQGGVGHLTSDEYVWNHANRKISFISRFGNFDDIGISEVGFIEESLRIIPDSSPPIRVKPDGSFAVLGSGAMIDTINKRRLSTTLANGFSDLVFLGDDLRTMRSFGNGVTQFQSWVDNSGSFDAEPSFELQENPTRQVAGSPLRLFSWVDGDTLVAVVMEDEKPTFQVMDHEFNDVDRESSLVGRNGDELENP